MTCKLLKQKKCCSIVFYSILEDKPKALLHFDKKKKHLASTFWLVRGFYESLKNLFSILDIMFNKALESCKPCFDKKKHLVDFGY